MVEELGPLSGRLGRGKTKALSPFSVSPQLSPFYIYLQREPLRARELPVDL